jgi:DNA-binding transcriptional ArsR family regulator
LSDVEPLAISEALERLREAGAVHVDGERVWAAGAVRHVDGLGMVSI